MQMTTIPELALVCTVPTCLGFWKREYGVSYAYGISIAASALLVLQEGPASVVARRHAWVHVAYGARLCAFLLWRELSVPRFRRLREKIERSAPSGSRLQRAPFVFGCSLLYLCMSLPLVLSARAGPVDDEGLLAAGAKSAAAAAAVAAAWAGFGLAALGDTWKSVAKATRGEKALVVGGPFAVLRHPNYQGEQLLWAASTLAGLALAPASLASAATVAGALVGLAGIQFVLVQATTGLNARHKLVYADDKAYRTWAAWPGFEFSKPSKPSGPPSGVDTLYK